MRQILFMMTGIFLMVQVRAQDVHFSQFYMSPLTQNPGLTGAVYDLQAILNYKNQWQSVGAPYTTYAFSYDMRLTNRKHKKGFWAAGINAYSDRSGDARIGLTQANLSAAYHVHLDEYNTLGAGLQGGFAQRSIGYGALQWGNQFNGSNYDPGMPSLEPVSNAAFTYLDMGGGVVWNYNNTSGSKNVTDNHDLKITLGASVFHPNQPRYSYYNDGDRLYMKAVFHGNALISIPSTSLALAPGFMYYRQGNTQELYAGALIRYKIRQDSKYTGFEKGAAISAGAYYRAQDAVAAMVLLEYANYSIGMSYDLNTSSLRSASSLRGGLEISLRFVTPNPFLKRTSSSILYQPTP
ncbi:MAG TPA: PorP/SprF family type IX secretion system membrane protein [Bacteroidia bacterium]|nr:PorP/SprF family type IX secretion system membrane protein [Bacteroidia bacterium]